MLSSDAQKLLKYISTIAKPRRTGSVGETTTITFIVNVFKKLGLNVQEQTFRFPLILNQFIKAPVLIILLMLFILLFLFQVNPVFAGVVSALIIILLLSFLSGIPFAAMIKIISQRNLPFCKYQDSKNIIASIENTEGKYYKNRKPNIYILAHFDSKSQSLSIVHRIIIIVVSFIFSFYLSIQYIIFSLIEGVPGSSLYIIYGILIFSVFMLCTMSERNNSPGAMDNASGVSILLHLAEIMAKDPNRFKDTNITFIATGAEEEGLVGAFHFCQSLINSPISKDNSYFINLDGVGLDGHIYCSHRIGMHYAFSNSQNKFAQLVKEAGKNNGLKVNAPPLVVGAAADHFPFIYDGFNAITLSTVSRKCKVIHTHKDTTDKIEIDGLRKIELLVLAIIDKIKRN